MVKFVVVLMLMILSVSTAFAGNSLTVGVVDPSDTNITSIEYARTEAGTGLLGSELVLSYAGAFKALNQDDGNKRYGLSIGAYATKGKFTVDGGYGLYYQTVPDSVDPGLYGGAKIDIAKNLFVEAKYTYVFDNKDTNSWQFGVGLKY